MHLSFILILFYHSFSWNINTLYSQKSANATAFLSLTICVWAEIFRQHLIQCTTRFNKYIRMQWWKKLPTLQIWCSRYVTDQHIPTCQPMSKVRELIILYLYWILGSELYSEKNNSNTFSEYNFHTPCSISHHNRYSTGAVCLPILTWLEHCCWAIIW